MENHTINSVIMTLHTHAYLYLCVERTHHQLLFTKSGLWPKPTLAIISSMTDSALHITVKPKSPRNEVLRTTEGVTVRVTAAPVEGAANIAVVKTLSVALNIPKSRLAITSGTNARQKRVCISGITADELQQKLASLPFR